MSKNPEGKSNPTAEFLRQRWLTPTDGASYRGSLNALRHQGKLAGVKINEADARKWLKTQDAYTLHRKTVNKFQRRKVMTRGIGNVLAVDLVDYSKFSHFNRGFKWLLTSVDCFSRKAFVRPLKDKRGVTVALALDEIFKEFTPTKLWVDCGKEFWNRHVSELLVKYDINMYHTYNREKSVMVEIFNRTIRRRITRYMCENNTKSFVDDLQKIVEGYNSSYHRTLKCRPIDVSKQNEKEIWQRLYSTDNYKSKPPRLKVGDYVRLSVVRGVFEKATERPGFTEEVFRVTEVHRPELSPPLYTVQDLAGEAVLGKIYEFEACPVSFSEETKSITKLHRTRVSRGRKERLVSYKGYPVSYKQWVDNKTYLKLKDK